MSYADIAKRADVCVTRMENGTILMVNQFELAQVVIDLAKANAADAGGPPPYEPPVLGSRARDPIAIMNVLDFDTVCKQRDIAMADRDLWKDRAFQAETEVAQSRERIRSLESHLEQAVAAIDLVAKVHAGAGAVQECRLQRAQWVVDQLANAKARAEKAEQHLAETERAFDERSRALAKEIERAETAERLLGLAVEVAPSGAYPLLWADRDDWKARAEKAEAEANALRERPKHFDVGNWSEPTIISAELLDWAKRAAEMLIHRGFDSWTMHGGEPVSMCSDCSALLRDEHKPDCEWAALNAEAKKLFPEVGE